MNPNHTSTHGFALFLVIAMVYLLNFFIARYVTIIMIEQKFVKKKSEELSKMKTLWFFPVVGAVGLFMLLLTHQFLRFWAKASKWLFLKHI